MSDQPKCPFPHGAAKPRSNREWWPERLDLKVLHQAVNGNVVLNERVDVFTTGDNAYPSGRAQDYRDCYEPAWGRHKDRTRPSPGNHDYESPGAAPYFQYFGTNAGPAGRG